MNIKSAAYSIDSLHGPYQITGEGASKIRTCGKKVRVYPVICTKCGAEYMRDSAQLYHSEYKQYVACPACKVNGYKPRKPKIEKESMNDLGKLFLMGRL